LLLVVSFAPFSIVSGTDVPNSLAPFMVITPEPLIITPPVPENVVGHSDETARAEIPALYCNVAADP